MLGFVQTAMLVLCLVLIVMFGLSFTKLDKSKVFYLIWTAICLMIAAAYAIRLSLHDTSTTWPIASVALWSFNGLAAFVLFVLMRYEEKQREKESRRIIIPTREQVVAINQEVIDNRLNDKRNGG